MRRLRQTRIRSFLAAPRILTKDREGVPDISYGECFEIKGYLWPATSKKQVEQYGDRIDNIANMRIEGLYQIRLTPKGAVQVQFKGGRVLTPGDGIYVYADPDTKPDYQIISVTQYYPLKLEVERLV